MTRLSREETWKVGCMGNEGDERKIRCRNNDNVVDGFVKADVEGMRGGGG